MSGTGPRIYFTNVFGDTEKSVPAGFTREAGITVDYARTTADKLKKGIPIEPEEFPKQAFWNMVHRRRRVKVLPDFFILHRFFCCSQKYIEVFRQFDLGHTQIAPIPFFQNDDGVTEIPGPNYLVAIGEHRDSIRPELSDPSDIKPCMNPHRYDIWPTKNDRPPQVVFSKEALEGPDLWIESRLSLFVFFSERLGEALIQQGLDKPFKLRYSTHFV